jgi:hypothetical protein
MSKISALPHFFLELGFCFAVIFLCAPMTYGNRSIQQRRRQLLRDRDKYSYESRA